MTNLFNNIFKDKSLEEQKKYLDWWINTFGWYRDLQLFDIDFNKPWWQIFIAQKKEFAILWGFQFVENVTWMLVPYLVAIAFDYRNWWLILGVLVFRILLTLLMNIGYYFQPIVFLQTDSSLDYAVSKFFLTVDPAYHVYRSTGIVVSKSRRGKSAIFNLLALTTWEVLEIIFWIFGVILALSVIHISLGIVSLAGIVLIISTSIWVNTFQNSRTRKFVNDKIDQVNDTAMENIQQVQYIRATYSSEIQLKKLSKRISESNLYDANGWYGYEIGITIPVVLYYLFLILLSSVVYLLFEQGVFTPAVALSAITTYIIGTNTLISIGEKIRRFMQNMTDVNDLFEFIRSFGKQTFPVLESDAQTKTQPTI